MEQGALGGPAGGARALAVAAAEEAMGADAADGGCATTDDVCFVNVGGWAAEFKSFTRRANSFKSSLPSRKLVS